MKQIIVCAAMRHKSGLIVAGVRHCDSVMRPIIDRLGLGYNDWEQGFLNQKGEFIDRTVAWSIAYQAGQIRRATGFESNYNDEQNKHLNPEGYLFSENLY